jgi:hypothetical protein
MRVARLRFAIMRRVIETGTDKPRQYSPMRSEQPTGGFIGREPAAGARRNSILHNFSEKAFATGLYSKRRTPGGPTRPITFA